MPQSETTSTFKPSALANTDGVEAVAGQTLTIEFLSADPTLVSGVPRVWINTTTHLLKWTDDGVTTYTATST